MSVGKFACTPRRVEAVQGAIWAVERQRRVWAQDVYGGVVVAWAARRGRAARTDWESRAVAWRFRERRMDRQTKDRPRRADPADRGAATVTPARACALWSARVPTQLGLALFRRVFLKIFELKWTNI
jgi:hypothetical protein